METGQARSEPQTQAHINTSPSDLRKANKASETPAEIFVDNPIVQTAYGTDQKLASWLTVSPYLEPEHLLDLNSLDTPNRLLALALTELEPATADYATVKYEDAIDWSGLMLALKALVAREQYKWTRHEFYVVEFRSKLKKNIDVERLFQLDKQSHVEATQSGGLLKYWYGIPDVNRRNLATCKCY